MKLSTLRQKIFGFFDRNKKWSQDHIEYWSLELVIQSNGLSQFQERLGNELKGVWDSNKIKYSEEITGYRDIYDLEKVVNEISYVIKGDSDSEFWISHDMAEYEINGTHHIYEEWGYLKPQDLRTNYIRTMKELLKLN